MNDLLPVNTSRVPLCALVQLYTWSAAQCGARAHVHAPQLHGVYARVHARMRPRPCAHASAPVRACVLARTLRESLRVGAAAMSMTPPPQMSNDDDDSRLYSYTSSSTYQKADLCKYVNDSYKISTPASDGPEWGLCKLCALVQRRHQAVPFTVSAVYIDLLFSDLVYSSRGPSSCTSSTLCLYSLLCTDL